MENINIVEIITTGIIIQIIGALWYSPLLFGDKWMNLLKTNSEEIKAMGKTPHLVALLTAFLMATVMSVLLHWTGIDNMPSAIGLGALLWLGVTLPDSIPHYRFTKIPFGVLILDTCHTLAMLCVAAFVLSLWQ